MPTNVERRGICAAGNWIVDNVKTIDVWPHEETLCNILDERRSGGGAACNVLMGLAALDPALPLTAIGVLGQDAEGDALEAEMRGKGARVFFRRSAALPTSHTDVMTVRGTGRRTFFHNRGPNAELCPADFPWDALDARILHLGYLLLLESLDAGDTEYGTAAARVLAEARRRGIITSVDVVSEASDRFQRVARPALPHTDYLICNEMEAGRIAGLQLRKDDVLDHVALVEAATALLSMGVNAAVVIHAPEGGYARTKTGEARWQPALRLPGGYIQSSVGAGDAFCAGFLYATHENWPLARRLQLAVCAAAASLAHPTSAGGMASVEDALALAEKHPPHPGD